MIRRAFLAALLALSAFSAYAESTRYAVAQLTDGRRIVLTTDELGNGYRRALIQIPADYDAAPPDLPPELRSRVARIPYAFEITVLYWSDERTREAVIAIPDLPPQRLPFKAFKPTDTMPDVRELNSRRSYY